jgi:probable F420-dependent oxidoreductase
MQIETLLPLGKLDPGLRAADEPLDIRTVYDEAKRVEEIGYDAVAVEETKLDPYVMLGLAAQSTRTLGLTTAVAMAFPRSPTVTALSAWTLQKLSGGRLTLGLGSQVKGHIERRYGMSWSPPGPWMREYVQAMRAVWKAWQNGEQPDHQGEHYRISLTVPLFDPGPIEHPDIPVHLAAVNPYMCQVAGEVADGFRPHPVCTPKYIEEVMLPAAAKGAAKTGRDAKELKVAIKPLIATAPDEESLAVRIRDARARVAFYASTPAYRAAFDIHGLTDLTLELAELSKRQRWEEMPDKISDDVLHTYAVVATHDEIGEALLRRYAGLVTSAEFSIPVKSRDDEERLKGIVRDLKGA